jgi:hypothetical protein
MPIISTESTVRWGMHWGRHRQLKRYSDWIRLAPALSVWKNLALQNLTEPSRLTRCSLCEVSSFTALVSFGWALIAETEMSAAANTLGRDRVVRGRPDLHLSGLLLEHKMQ